MLTVYLTCLPRQKILYPLYFTFLHLALLANSRMDVDNAEVGIQVFSLHSPSHAVSHPAVLYLRPTYCTESILCHVQGILALPIPF
jgi:hypothetical protein